MAPILFLGDEFTRRRFVPETEMEHDIYDAFHQFKETGDGLFLFISNDYDREYSMQGLIFKEGYAPSDPDTRLAMFAEQIDAVKYNLSQCKVLVALDLSRSFDDQWPYKSGLWSPMPLRMKPILPPRASMEILPPDRNFQRSYGDENFEIVAFDPAKVPSRMAPPASAEPRQMQKLEVHKPG